MAQPHSAAPDDRSATLHDATGTAAVAALLRNSPDMVLLIGDDACIHYLSPAAEELLGAGPERFVGRPVLDLVHPDDLDAVTQDLVRIMHTRVSTGPIECRVVRADGTHRVVEVVGSFVGDVEGLDGTLVLNSRDVTDLRAQEEQLAFERTHDRVTGLGGERELASQVDQAMASAARNVTILAVGIDDLRGLAGGAGPDAQDAIVAALVERVAIRLDDPCAPVAAARVGTSTFVVLCADSEDPLEPLSMGEEARLAFSSAITVDGRTLRPSVSVGVVAARRGDDGRDVPGDALVDRAMLGLREARRQSGGITVVVDDALVEASQRAEAMARDLRAAVDSRTLDVHYQPKVALGSGRILGFEALARWTHPTWGSVPPPVFIELAEEHGLIDDLGLVILERAVADASLWPAGAGDDLCVAVNISARQFSPGLVPRVAATLERFAVIPGRLTLEVTESTVMSDPDAAATVLAELKQLGVRISIDDFGTGYSSLAHLRRFPIDELKIDKSFVDGLGTDPADSAIAAAIMAMAHALDLTVVAEGIEDDVQRTELRRLGAEQGQGYLFSRPLPEAEAVALVVDARRVCVRLVADGTDVVVADDAPEVLQLLTVSLAAAGFTPHAFSDGTAALAAIRRIRPVAAILDVDMPGLRGPDVCRLARTDPGPADCTFVALSAHSSADHHIEAFRAGVEEYIVKPFSPRDIVSRTTAAIDRRRQRALSSEAS